MSRPIGMAHQAVGGFEGALMPIAPAAQLQHLATLLAMRPSPLTQKNKLRPKAKALAHGLLGGARAPEKGRRTNPRMALAGLDFWADFSARAPRWECAGSALGVR